MQFNARISNLAITKYALERLCVPIGGRVGHEIKREDSGRVGNEIKREDNFATAVHPFLDLLSRGRSCQLAHLSCGH